jgi:hypothetical protein
VAPCRQRRAAVRKSVNGVGTSNEAGDCPVTSRVALSILRRFQRSRPRTTTMPQCKRGYESGQTTNHGGRDTSRAAYWAPCDYASRPHFIPADQLACCCVYFGPASRAKTSQSCTGPCGHPTFLHHVSTLNRCLISTGVSSLRRWPWFTCRLEGDCLRLRQDSLFHLVSLVRSLFSSRILPSLFAILIAYRRHRPRSRPCAAIACLAFTRMFYSHGRASSVFLVAAQDHSRVLACMMHPKYHRGS